jgi:predicted secreted protein
MRVYHDPNFPIGVTLGEVFAISLESIPSTGYTWKTEYDFSMIKLIKPQKFVPRTSRIGGGGEEIFEFKTKQLGDTQIKMMYQREWETTPRKIELFTVHIT